MDIVFRVDSSTEIGAGHIIRCLTLADELSKREVNIKFICRDLPGHLGNLVIKKNYILKLYYCIRNTLIIINTKRIIR